MIIEYNKEKSDEFYFLMIQGIIPRPIAWVLSLNPDGSYNLAPFSFFNGITSEPPILMISVGWKDDTTRKDTWVNIDERKEFVVHIPPLDQSQQVVQTSAALALNDSEIPLAKLKTVNQNGWNLPRLLGPKVAFYCKKHKIIEVGEEKQGLILGEITQAWVDDQALSKSENRLVVDPEKINPLSRLGGKSYSGLGSVFDIKRPKDA